MRLIIDGGFGAFPIFGESLQSGAEVVRLGFTDATVAKVYDAIGRRIIFQAVQFRGLLVRSLLAEQNILVWHGQFAQLFQHGLSFQFSELREFVDDLDCAHGNNVFSPRGVVILEFVILASSFLHPFLFLHERDDFAEVVHHGLKLGDGFAGEILRFG